MRVVAVCAIVVFVAWVSEQALTPPTIADRELRAPVYAVLEPVPTTTVAVPTPTGEVVAPTSTAAPPMPQRTAGPVAVVVALAERGTVQQVTATVPPPMRLPVDGDCESWRPLLAKYGIPYDGAARIMARESGCAMVDNYNTSTRDDSLCAFQLNRWGALDAAWTAAGFPRSYMATPEGCIDAAALYYHACGWGPWVKPYDCPGGWPL